MIYKHYEYFMTIAELGSITKAAEKLYVSQPSLSQYVKRLENELGVVLFDRKSSPLTLTYAGEKYYDSVKQVMRIEDGVIREFEEINSEIRGKLRLGVALWRGACLLPEVFPQYHSKYPAVELELTEGRSIQLINALRNDAIDIAVMNLPHTIDYSHLICDVIQEERILLAAPTYHPAVQKLLSEKEGNTEDAGELPIAPIALVNELPVILTKEGQNLTHEVRFAFNRHRLDPEILLETGNLTTGINLVVEGMGCAFVPEGGAKICTHPGLVTFFRTDDDEMKWPLAAVYRKDAYLSRMARLFIEELRNSLSN